MRLTEIAAPGAQDHKPLDHSPSCRMVVRERGEMMMPSVVYIIEVGGVEIHRLYTRIEAYGFASFVGADVRAVSLIEER